MSFIPIFDAIAPVVNKVLSFIPDPQERQKQEEFLINALKDWDSQQTAINIEEAKNENVFVSGWRPAVGWCCAVAFAYHLIVQPFLTYCMLVFGYSFPLPLFDEKLLADTLYGMLGFGSLRTVEKLASSGHLPWQQ